MSMLSRTAIAFVPSLLLLGACTNDAPVEPGARGSPARALATTVPGNELAVVHSTQTKYREQTRPYASARAGSAIVTARALLGKDAYTTLDATTGDLDVAGAPGTIKKVQIKTFDNAGTLLSALNAANAAPTYSARLFGRMRHSTIQLQANVTGIDDPRTDVVTVTSLVQLRPDLAVTDIASPATVGVGNPVHLSATVAEQNHDVGANADCVLYVDAAEAERLSHIWVANGDQVTCAFSDYTFTTAGQHTIEVRAESVTPGDWDTANNAFSKTIQVVEPVDVMDEAWVEGRSSKTKDWSTWDQGSIMLVDGPNSVGNGETDTTWADTQTISFYADAFAVFVTDPSTLVLEEFSDGLPLARHEMSGPTNFNANVRYLFADGWHVTFGVTIKSRPTATPFRDIAQYVFGTRSSRQVEFFKQGFGDVFSSDGLTEVGQTVWFTSAGPNPSNTSNGSQEVGDAYRLKLTLTGGGAPYQMDRVDGPSPTNNPAYTRVVQGPIVFDKTFPIAHSRSSWQTPVACDTEQDEFSRIWYCSSNGGVHDLWSFSYANYLGFTYPGYDPNPLRQISPTWP